MSWFMPSNTIPVNLRRNTYREKAGCITGMVLLGRRVLPIRHTVISPGSKRPGIVKCTLPKQFVAF
jgi:hypothetical protein